jgi:hypothetical protein
VRAIVAGERDPVKLAERNHPGIQVSRGKIAKSLEGNWRPELIFVLQQEIDITTSASSGSPSATGNKMFECGMIP